MMQLENRELSVRIDPQGGDPATSVQVGPDGGASGHGRIIILLHGYANTLDGARSSYSTFEGNLLKQQPTIGNANLPHVFRMYWPGDSKLMKPFYYASYPADIGIAVRSAAPIEEYLRNLAPPPGGTIEVFLIAHSLGNRVLLELLERFTAGNKPAMLQIQGTIMMAAAVPVARVRFGGSLHYASLLASRRFTLHSRSDLVLMLGFAPGEIAGFDALPLPWDWPQAVGRNGNPLTNWTYQESMQKSANGKGYGHGDYWPGTEVSGPVAQALGLPTANQVPPAGIDSNALPTAPGPPSAGPATRSTPTRPPFG